MELDTLSAPSQPWTANDETLSDEQIEELLRQAEQRLQAVKSSKSSTSTYALPRSAKLDLSSLPQPYVAIDKSIARTDDKRLLEDKNRQAANGIRKVEDPLVVKQKKIEVSVSALFISSICLGGKYPKLFLKRDPGRRLGCLLAFLRAFIT